MPLRQLVRPIYDIGDIRIVRGGGRHVAKTHGVHLHLAYAGVLVSPLAVHPCPFHDGAEHPIASYGEDHDNEEG